MYCRMCGGELIFLGTLGNRNHFRCRNCGIGASQARGEDDFTGQDEDDYYEEMQGLTSVADRI